MGLNLNVKRARDALLDAENELQEALERHYGKYNAASQRFAPVGHCVREVEDLKRAQRDAEKALAEAQQKLWKRTG